MGKDEWEERKENGLARAEEHRTARSVSTTWC